MAKFRNVSVKFWSDPFIESLTPEKKYFFLYLITNEHSSQCGIYEISFRSMAFETGYNQETIEKLVQFFEKAGKIKYSRKTNEIAIRNFVKHNPQGSPKVAAFVQKELKQVKDRLLIPYLYATDTVSQEEQEEEETQEEEQEQKKKEDPLRAFLDLLSGDLKIAYAEWIQYRKELGKKITPSTAKKQLKFLGGRDPAVSVAIINQSIENGWTGLFELKQNGTSKTSKQEQSTATAEYLAKHYRDKLAGKQL